MQRMRLEAQLRESGGKGAARATRRDGFVPGIIYGHKLAPVNIKLPEPSFRRFLVSGAENVIINMDMGGEEVDTVMIKEVQTDPATREIMHADFVRVSLQERITTTIPVALTGTPAGVLTGGVLEFVMREIRVECMVGNLPEHIEIDVSSLEIGEQVRVQDAKIEEGITVLDDPSALIVTIAAPTVLKEETTEEAAGIEKEEDMEPEVISEKGKEEEEAEK